MVNMTDSLTGKPGRQILLDFSQLDRTKEIQVLSVNSWGDPVGPSHSLSVDPNKLHDPLIMTQKDDIEKSRPTFEDEEESQMIDYANFHFAGYKISKRVCFGSTITACICLIGLIVAVVLVVIYVDDGETTTVVEEAPADDFYNGLHTNP